MRRRYTIHKDGDLLVEDLDAAGRPVDPEPVPPEERQPISIVLEAPESEDAKAQLIDLLELALGMETDGPGNDWVEKPKGHKLKVLD